MAGGVHSRRVCMTRGHAWQGGMCVARGACMAGCVHGRGCVWQGACMAGGVHGKGACIAGGHVHGRGVCMAGGHVWQGGHV